MFVSDHAQLANELTGLAHESAQRVPEQQQRLQQCATFQIHKSNYTNTLRVFWPNTRAQMSEEFDRPSWEWVCELKTRVQRDIMAGNGEVSGELGKEEEDSENLFEFGDDLELNQFDGLPYSSRYYRLLQERKILPVWKYRHEFMTLLENNQILIVSGTTKTGKSTQVSDWDTHTVILTCFYPRKFSVFTPRVKCPPVLVSWTCHSYAVWL